MSYKTDKVDGFQGVDVMVHVKQEEKSRKRPSSMVKNLASFKHVKLLHGIN